ncbi:cuticle protein 18.7-like [Uranotaenia lowii]|nr:cuticle protein 18.7-like [Uranotaenia lowii]
MKAFVLGSVLLLASASAGYVPADTPEVAHAKAAHFAAHAAAHTGHHYAPAAPAGHWDNHHHEQKWHGPLHFPKIHNGVPVETPEVQHAKAAHFAAIAKEGAHAPAYHGHDDHAHWAPAHHEQKWHGPQHIPVIHNGVPVETPEVQHAKAAHLSALHGAHAGSYAGGAHWGGPSGHEDDGSYRPEHHNYH